MFHLDNNCENETIIVYYHTVSCVFLANNYLGISKDKKAAVGKFTMREFKFLPKSEIKESV